MHTFPCSKSSVLLPSSRPPPELCTRNIQLRAQRISIHRRERRNVFSLSLFPSLFLPLCIWIQIQTHGISFFYSRLIRARVSSFARPLGRRKKDDDFADTAELMYALFTRINSGHLETTAKRRYGRKPRYHLLYTRCAHSSTLSTPLRYSLETFCRMEPWFFLSLSLSASPFLSPRCLPAFAGIAGSEDTSRMAPAVLGAGDSFRNPTGWFFPFVSPRKMGGPEGVQGVSYMRVQRPLI